MHDALMGLETEYAFTAFGHYGRPLNRTLYSRRLVDLAARQYSSLYGRDRYDLYLANGSRLYVDDGMGLINTEYSTPECTNPAELVAHVRAGDRLLAKLARTWNTYSREFGERLYPSAISSIRDTPPARTRIIYTPRRRQSSRRS